MSIFLIIMLRFLAVFYFLFITLYAVKIILDKKTGQSLGFAYIWFSRAEFAQKAVEEMNGEVYAYFFL